MLKHLFRRIGNKAEEMYERYRLNSFYLNGNATPSLAGKVLNIIFFNLMAFIFSYLWFMHRTGRLQASLLLAALLALLLDLAWWLYKRRLLKQKRQEKREQAAREYVYAKLIRLGPEEFKWEILKLVLRLPGAGSIKARLGFMETRVNGRRTAIGYFNDRFGDGVSARMLASFIQKAIKTGCNDAIFLTSGEYSEECREYAASVKNLKLYLLGKEDLLDMMEQAGMFPDDSAIDIQIDRMMKAGRRDYSRLRKEILAPRRAVSYLRYALFFMLAAMVVGAYRTYYLIFAAVFALMALFTRLYGLRQESSRGGSPEALSELTGGSLVKES